MKYLFKNYKQALRTVLFSLGLAILSLGAFAQVPDRPNPPHLVNDFAKLLNVSQISTLEQQLVTFNNQTSTQIAVVIVPSFEGDISMYAYELAHKWGIGQKGKNNGLLILVKPKNATKGGVFIATGYGVEGAVPDAVAKRIVQNEMIPRFQNNDYYGGIAAATKVIMDLTKGEYTADQYAHKKHKKESSSMPTILFIVFAVIIIVVISSVKSSFTTRDHASIGQSGIPWWIWLTMLGSANRSQQGGFGDFSSGSGGFGGFDGGGDSFGGFGGGDFGGGGAGGSW
jgi:uncharacterized protein